MELNFEYMGRIISFELRQTKRKTMEISIKPTGRIHVAAPLKVSKELITERVKSKAGWIIKKLEEIEKLKEKRFIREFKDDEKFLYLGREYELEITMTDKGEKEYISIDGSKLQVITSSEDKVIIKNALERWYRERALEIVHEFVKMYTVLFHKEPLEVKVKEQKKRWASCTGKDKLLFNWRLAMAPKEIIEYVVVHELCHMVHKNHSKEYWRLVGSIMPSYKEKREWLKKNGTLMEL